MPRAGATPCGLRASSQGFTLLEILVVMTIAAMLLALVPPLLSGAVPGARLKAAARDLVAGLRLARSRAITTNTVTELSLDPKTGEYRISGQVKPRHLPAGVQVQIQSNASGDAEASAVQFYPDGSSSGGRITLKGSGRAYSVEVDWLTGSVDLAEMANAG